ncbi:ribosome-binding factor A [bacterium BMS3Abin14]|nr:ribosome-binding factor A [bacterium BMS3Abin14]
MRRSLNYKRADRVAELIRHEMADILLKEIKDPRVGSVTLTSVKVTDDLRSARVYFGVLDRTTHIEEIENGLEAAAGYFHRLLLKRLRLKTVPHLTFHFDQNLDYSFHISEILKDLEEGEE